MRFLLDTHVWLWALTAPDKLHPRVVSVIEDVANELWLSPISIWEFLLLAEKRHVEVVGDCYAWLDRAGRDLPVRSAQLNREVAVECRRLDLPLQDTADRFIAATASVYDLVLVTSDKTLLRTTAVETLSNR